MQDPQQQTAARKAPRHVAWPWEQVLLARHGVSPKNGAISRIAGRDCGSPERSGLAARYRRPAARPYRDVYRTRQPNRMALGI
jgi:hypothetical protein